MLLDKLKLIEGDYLKRAAVLLFHPDPERFVSGASIKIGYFASETDLRYHDRGVLFTQAGKTMELLLTKYLKAGISYERIQRIESCPMPDPALREALLNAIVHRDCEVVCLAVVSRLAWIRRKQQEFARQDRQSQREMVTGENRSFQGRRYLLDVDEGGGRTRVRLAGHRTMALRVPPGYDREQRDAVLQRWHRRQLRALLPGLRAKWEPRAGTTVAEVRIKRMKTRWGSCNADCGRIWLNLELSKKPVGCLEYVLVHEMVHLHERHHTERFVDLMDSLMPTWQVRREELKRAPLAHEEWDY